MENQISAAAQQPFSYEELNTFGKIGYINSLAYEMGEVPSSFLYKNILECIDLYTSLEERDLCQYCAIVVPMAIDEVYLSKFSQKLLDYVHRGGILVSFASNFTHFLPYNSGYIQSKTPIKDREIRLESHMIFEGVREYDINFRRGVKGFFNRGYFDMSVFPKEHKLEIISRDSDGQCVGYIDRDSSNGTILATAGADLLNFGLFDNTTARRMGINLMAWIHQELLRQESNQNQTNKPKPPLKARKDFVFTTTAPNPRKSPLKNAIITGGASFHHYFFQNKNKKYENFFHHRIYFLDIDKVDFGEFDYIVLASRLNAEYLMPHKQKFLSYLESGGHIISFGEVTKQYLPNILWQEYPVNFWWWLIPGADTPLYIQENGKQLFSKMNVDAAKWHYHGAFYPPKNSQKILTNELDECIIYKDTTFRGNLYVTSLDPDFHLGQGFMPKTEGFFDNFMEWAELDMRVSFKEPCEA